MTRPIVKWVGGKRALLDELIGRVPNRYDCYYELFGGGAALRLALPPGYAVIADANFGLVKTYSTIMDDCTAVIERLEIYREEYMAGTPMQRAQMFYRIREEYRWDAKIWTDSSQQAARFLFLNRTCFNGLYRENSSGQFNSPFGHLEKPAIVPGNLLDFRKALFGTHVLHGDFREFLYFMRGGDFAYLDPPYDGTYSGYTSAGFGSDDLRELSEQCVRLDKKGIFWMLSNSDTCYVRELFKGFRIETVMAPRNVNRNGNGRGKVSELIIRNY